MYRIIVLLVLLLLLSLVDGNTKAIFGNTNVLPFKSFVLPDAPFGEPLDSNLIQNAHAIVSIQDGASQMQHSNYFAIDFHRLAGSLSAGNGQHA